MLETRLGAVDAVLHNQDNREHDLLDSDDYYQFEGGLALVVRHLSGRAPAVYHNDHSRPDRPRIRTLREELGRVVRGRAANPRWIAGVMRHGYKGAAEIAATVDYLFAFAATARAVDDAHFDALYDAYLGDETVRGFMAEHNPAALAEISRRFAEAIERGLWRPRRNSAREALTKWSTHERLVETEEEVNRLHREKMARRKAARDRMLATKTEERGLLIVHTGAGKGKSTAAFGMVLRCIGHGMRVGVVQFVKGAWGTGERNVLEVPRSRDLPRDGRGLHLGHPGPRPRHRRRAHRLGDGEGDDRRSVLPAGAARRAQHRAALRLSAARRGVGGAEGESRATCTSSSPAATPSPS